jgi:hypothetical protein
MLQGGVVRVCGSGVLQQVLDKEHVAWDTLHWLDEQVIQSQLPVIIPCPLLFGEGQGEERGKEGKRDGGKHEMLREGEGEKERTWRSGGED